MLEETFFARRGCIPPTYQFPEWLVNVEVLRDEDNFFDALMARDRVPIFPSVGVTVGMPDYSSGTANYLRLIGDHLLFVGTDVDGSFSAY
jgi:hypothetical protein